MRRAIPLLVATACAPASGDRNALGTSSSTADSTASSSISTTTASTSSDPTTADSTTTTADTNTTTTTTDPAPLSLTRIADTFPIPSLAAATPKRFADVAYDPASDVYLAVNGNVAISGTFVAGDATIVSDAFSIADVAYAQGCRVAFGSTSFLVAWHDNRTAPRPTSRASVRAK